MIQEQNKSMVGIDLCPSYAQITFSNRSGGDPVTVSTAQGIEKYNIPIPKDLFSLVEQRAELGTALLSNFFKECFGMLNITGPLMGMKAVVTMEKVRPAWVEAILDAMEMLGIPAVDVAVEDHLESFYHYVIHQKRDLWSGNVALLEYKKDIITGYSLSLNYRTTPALAKVEQGFKLYLDEKARSGQSDEDWKTSRDTWLLDEIKQMFQGKNFTGAFMVGEDFNRSWMDKSLQFLCMQRHAYQGGNLFTKGACYSAMEKAEPERYADFLFDGPDMLEYNVGMPMIIRGKNTYFPLIGAGINWYMARNCCEFILDDTREINLYTKSLGGVEGEYIIPLEGLPDRPNRATRIRMEISFVNRSKCRVRLDDMGLGDLYPSSGMKWESNIQL